MSWNSRASSSPKAAQQAGDAPKLDDATEKLVKEAFGKMRVVYRITAPFEVVSHNATRREGKTLVWEYDMETFEKMAASGKVDASNGDDMPTQITVAAYPLLMHQDGPQDLDVAVVGFDDTNSPPRGCTPRPTSLWPTDRCAFASTALRSRPTTSPTPPSAMQ